MKIRTGAARLVALLLALLAMLPGAARAQTPPADMGVSIMPTLSMNASTLPWGWTSVVVTITNNSGAPARGEARAALHQYGNKRNFESRAPYAVAAGATVSVVLPVDISAYAQINVDVVDAARGEIASANFSAVDPSNVVLLDVSGSQLKGAINEVPVVSLFDSTSHSSRGSSSAQTIGVVIPRVDAATGDPLLPDRAALYSAVDAVLVRSDMLARLGAAEVEALAGFVLAGGTVAITVTRPEDVRNPILTALCGGEVTLTSVSSEALRPLILAKPSISTGGRDIPIGLAPGEDMSKGLNGFHGGNLRGTSYGSSAPYGLGEVHLLAFDPTKKPGLDDNWVKVRMIDLVRRAYDRRASIVFRSGENDETPNLQKVRRQLDPNESSRWAIGAAAVLLLAYAIFAGPVNYSIAARKNKPLQAIRMLPIYSAIMFFIIVGIGVVAKGVTGRARHLSFMEAGAGMSKATIRRYRGFFASRAKELTVRTTDPTSLVRTALVAEPGEVEDKLVIDREGARLENVNALPWQTLVLREDGISSLGEGITILKKEAGITVKNRSGHDLRGALLWMPKGDVRYFAKIADGEAVDSSAGREIGTLMKDRSWLSAVTATHPAGTMRIHGLGAYSLGPILDEDAPGLAEAWQALEEAAENDASWFLDDVPVLLAQMDGGEGKSSDSGLRLEQDRLLVRVVGYGGVP